MTAAVEQRSTQKRVPLNRPPTRGVHHLVFCTDDMKKTVDFYVDVMKFPLIHVMRVPPGLGTGPKNRGNPPYEECRHYFFDMGNDSILAFFEVPKGAEPAANRNAVGAAQHCAFVVSPERFREFEEDLKQANIPYLPPVEQGPGCWGIYLYDPNGIRLEVACHTADGPDQQVIGSFTQTKARARAELESLPGATPEWVEKRLAALPD